MLGYLYNFTKLSGLLGFEWKMAFAKFEGNRSRIDGEIAENHAIRVNLTASIDSINFKTVQ